MKKVLMVVLVFTTLISCKKEEVNPNLKNVLFTTHVTTFKDGTTWTVVNNPRVNNN